ncbi:Uncharacterized protein FWK35_00037242, partial [Aphis craccivora]
GHQGVSRTIKRIKLHRQWKGLKCDLKKFIAVCQSCQQKKSMNRTIKQPKVVTKTANKPFEKVFHDTAEPLTTTNEGHSYILTIQENVNKFSAVVTHDANSATKTFVERFICQYCIPESIVTDCDTELMSKIFKEYYLDDYVAFAIFVYNTTIHTTTNHQPYELVYGFPATISHTLSRTPQARYNYDDYSYELKQKLQVTYKTARNNIINKKEKAKKKYDQGEVQVNVKVGDQVWIKPPTRKGN